MNIKLRTLVLLMSAAAMGAGCDGPQKDKTPINIGAQMTPDEIEAGLFTPEVMWKMGRIGGHALSPDGTQVIYTATWYDLAQNRSVSNLYVMPAEGGEPRQLLDNDANDFDARWSVSGDRIYFLSDRGGDVQVWSVGPTGEALKQISEITGGVEGFGIAPSEDIMFYAQRVQVVDRASSAIHSDMEQSKALIYDDLMVRHWNYWDRGEHMHIFVTRVENGRARDGKDIMPGEPWDAPMAPYFDMAEIAWNNAGTQLAYTCKKTVGWQYATQTDSDIYVYDVAAETTTNINKQAGDAAMPGYDRYPAFSPDDTRIAFTSMARPGNEADKERLFVWDSRDNSMTYLTERFDSHAFNAAWSDNNNIAFLSPLESTHQLCTVEAAAGAPVVVRTEGDHDISAFSMSGDKCIVSLTTLSSGAELFDLDKGRLTQITFINKHIYDNVRMGEVQKRWFKTTDGKRMLAWVVLPPNFDESRQYPALLYCQGGPQSTLGWSYRWNYQLMAAQDYVVVVPARRGVPGFGQQWIDEISGDYSGQNIRDLLTAIDEVAKEPWVDGGRLGAVGASYGGYTTFYLAGTHQKRFKAFISHCGIFNFESMYGHTEELFFVNNDYGGPYWDKNNPTAQRSYANSPHRFVANWDTPILIITGALDYRIPYSQSLEAFTAARIRGVDSRLVVFENEAHQVFKPQNNIVWNREFFGWLDKYLK